ncbi:hypothetical protein B0H16DRAFT_1585233 [Mycena metata]|uniref:Uncharacterized protein n=1 Tax=Mycena metata TaxID=1033252 RepID=A0AAD7HYL9_9AGAR|nr:hypothetical protein B0H16DRAFT_1585233 [Mycena metata]
MSLLYGEDKYSYVRQTHSTASPSRSRSPVAATQNLNATTISTNHHVKPTTQVPAEAVTGLSRFRRKLLSSAAALIDEIASCKASGKEVASVKVSPAIWPRLYEEISERERTKLEYCPHTEILTVTWPSYAHESFKFVISPFVNIAQGSNAFTWETNTEIQINRGPHDGERITPNFALGRELQEESIEFPIVVESAFSQSIRDLEEKVKKFLTRTDVELVVGLYFETPQFNNPLSSTTNSSKTNEDPLDFPTFAAGAEIEELGPVKYGGRIWAHAITSIRIILWYKGRGEGTATREEWDIFPKDDDSNLIKSQKEVVDILRDVTLGVVGRDDFDLIYQEKHGFTIDWQGFYPDLRRRLISDAFKRCYAWTRKTSSPTRAPVVPIERGSIRKRLAPADSDDSKGEAVKQPPHKIAKHQ